MIRQGWLREILVAWIAETKPTTIDVRRAHMAMQTAARALDALPGSGLDRLGMIDAACPESRLTVASS